MIVITDDPHTTTAINTVLLARLRASSPSFFTFVDSTVEQQRIAFTFRGPTPTRGDMAALVGTTGYFDIIADSTTEPIIDSSDVLDANAAFNEGRFVLNIRLTPAAGARMYQWTKAHRGKLLTARLDGKAISIARVGSPFRDKFYITDERFDATYVKRLAIYLRSGPLPGAARLAD